MIGVALSAFASWLGSTSVLKFIAMKALLYTLLVVILPLVLWNLGVDWFEALLAWTLGALPTDTMIYNATGMAGWFLVQFKIPEVITVLLGALSVKFVIGFIR